LTEEQEGQQEFSEEPEDQLSAAADFEEHQNGRTEQIEEGEFSEPQTVYHSSAEENPETQDSPFESSSPSPETREEPFAAEPAPETPADNFSGDRQPEAEAQNNAETAAPSKWKRLAKKFRNRKFRRPKEFRC
jgi:hypothetical protein